MHLRMFVCLFVVCSVVCVVVPREGVCQGRCNAVKATAEVKFKFDKRRGDTLYTLYALGFVQTTEGNREGTYRLLLQTSIDRPDEWSNICGEGWNNAVTTDRSGTICAGYPMSGNAIGQSYHLKLVWYQPGPCMGMTVYEEKGKVNPVNPEVTRKKAPERVSKKSGRADQTPVEEAKDGRDRLGLLEASRDLVRPFRDDGGAVQGVCGRWEMRGEAPQRYVL